MEVKEVGKRVSQRGGEEGESVGIWRRICRSARRTEWVTFWQSVRSGTQFV